MLSAFSMTETGPVLRAVSLRYAADARGSETCRVANDVAEYLAALRPSKEHGRYTGKRNAT